MKRLMQVALVVVVAFLGSGCAQKSYVGKVDVVGIGAGPKPVAQNKNSVVPSKLNKVSLLYADKIKVEKQKTSKPVAYLAGRSLVKKYSGEPKFLVDYLNAYQSLDNKILIIDKNGVVAWAGYARTDNIKNAQGVYDYGLTGVDSMSFAEAMEKFVIDEDEAEDYDADKKFNFEELKASLFSRSDRHPLLFTKLPDMQFISEDGKSVRLSQFVNNHKPTVLLFYMSKADNTRSLIDDVNKAASMVKMFSGGESSGTGEKTPEKILEDIQTYYLTK